MGVQVNKTKQGNGPSPKAGQQVSVHCTGYVVSTGKKFWSTKDPGQQVFSFTIGRGQVIKGIRNPKNSYKKPIFTYLKKCEKDGMKV